MTDDEFHCYALWDKTWSAELANHVMAFAKVLRAEERAKIRMGEINRPEREELIRDSIAALQEVVGLLKGRGR